MIRELIWQEYLGILTSMATYLARFSSFKKIRNCFHLIIKPQAFGLNRKSVPSYRSG